MKKSKSIMIYLLLASISFIIVVKSSDASSGKVLDKISQLVAMNIMEMAAKSGKTNSIVVEHELHNVTPEMITWWWDNIKDTKRYKLWHPKDHIAFEWIVPPGNGHVGAIQKATEKIGGVPMALNIRWDDSTSVETKFDNVLAASIISEKGEVLMRFSHEYESTEYGTHMRSTFHVSKGIPWFIKKGLKKHNREEMANFCNFLPDLYNKSVNDDD